MTVEHQWEGRLPKHTISFPRKIILLCKKHTKSVKKVSIFAKLVENMEKQVEMAESL